MQRAQALNPSAVTHWFNLVEAEIVKKGITPENIYTMDESGCPPANQGVSRVVARAGYKVVHKQGGANKETVTVLVTICADGTAIDPAIIFKGERLYKRWTIDNLAQASFAMSPNSWTDQEIAYQWLEKHFEPLTRERAAGCARVLILDGHSSHYSLPFLEFAIAHNIVVLGYPLLGYLPHCTHALQGLDVVCFAKMKRLWHAAIDEFETRTLRPLGKDEFASVFGNVYLTAFTSDTIKAAFRVTGIHPFDRTVITPQQMKPSEVTSTDVRTVFPLPQPSPVRRVIAVFHHYQPSQFELDPETHLSNPKTPQMKNNQVDGYTSEGSNSPYTPTHGKRPHAHVIDASIDPALYTPSKRARILTSSLAQSTSGSFLVSKAKQNPISDIAPPIRESPPTLDEPDWTLIKTSERLHESATKEELKEHMTKLTDSLALAGLHIRTLGAINEAANAQLVVQNMYAGKMKVNMNKKKKKKQQKRDTSWIFMEGKGRLLTDPAVIQHFAEEEERKLQEETEKVQRQEETRNKCTERALFDARWEQVKQNHAAALQIYEANCRQWQAEGRRKKDYGPKPKRPKKPETLEELERALGGHGGGRESDGGNRDRGEHNAAA
ncbi:hypothetical protein ACEPAI_2462 [Sanghuangporus weigelae]